MSQSGNGEVKNEKVEHIELENIVGAWGPFQRKLFLFMTFIYLISPFQNLGIVFYAPTLKYTCIDTMVNQTFVNDSIIQPTDQCWSSEGVKCKKWKYDLSVFKSTVVNEFDLVCDRAWLVTISSAAAQVGFMFSALVLGYISDRFGRLKVLRTSIFLEVLASLSLAASLSIYQFILSRFFIGLFAFGRYLSGYLLLLEWVGKHYRANVTLMFELGWVFGYMAMSLIAYFLPHFRYLQLLVCCVEVISFFWLRSIPDSPLWQISKGRITDAQETIRKATKLNGEISDEELDRAMKILKANIDKENAESKLVNQNIMQLWKRPLYLKYCLALYFTWFTAANVYYGLSLNAGDIGGSIFVNSFFYAFAEGVSKILLYYGFAKAGRRILMCASLLGSGLACVAIIPFIGKSYGLIPTLIFSFIGRFSISCTYHVMYLQTSEIFPTSLRQLGVGSCSAAARLGSISAPFVRDFSARTNQSITMFVFGVLSIADSMVTLLLPETKNIEIPNTIDEAVNTHSKAKTSKTFTSL